MVTPIWAVAVLWTLYVAPGAEAGRILAFLPFPGKSHLITFTALTRGLADRGHEVTLVCGVPQDKNHPNQKVINIGNAMDEQPHLANTSELLHAAPLNTWSAAVSEVYLIQELGLVSLHHAMSHPEVQALLRRPVGHYDAVLVEAFFGQEALLGLGHKLRAPVIALHSFGDMTDLSYAVGGVFAPSYKPHVLLDLSDQMSLLERTKNLVFSLLYITFKRCWLYREQQRALDRYFPGSPPLDDLLSNISLTILNTHPALCYPAPTPPNVIYAGGMHIMNTSPKPLSQDLKAFLDGAEKGVVYFSLGSFLRVSDMTHKQSSAFMKTFRSLAGHRFLVKWNGEPPEDVPNNVRLEPWLPQDDVLAHSKMKLFITHGGLLSIQEAIFHGVPVIGIPRFGDQMFNMQMVQRKGAGLQLDFHNISEGSVQWVIREVLQEPRYAEVARRLSRQFRAPPAASPGSPLDQALFWVEHVMQCGGDHLRPSSVRLTWYQTLMLDVALLLSLPVFAAALLLRAIRTRNRALSSANNKEKKS